MKIKIKNTRAFSLIETIIAITVIALVITAAASLTQSSLKISRTTTLQLQAYHLAEEGLEIVRNVRDSNWIGNKKWRDQFAVKGLYVVSQGALPYRLEMISSETAAEKIALSQIDTFLRYLRVDDLDDGSVRVTSIVSYNDHGVTKKATLTTDFTNWKKGPL